MLLCKTNFICFAILIYNFLWVPVVKKEIGINGIIFVCILALLLKGRVIMSTPKYKHFSFEDRCVIEEYLNRNCNFSHISNRLGEHRTTIAKEVYKHRFLRGNASPERPCCFESKPPYVCNSCQKFEHCKRQKYSYR